VRTLAKPVYLGLREIVLRALVHPGPAPQTPKVVQSFLVICDRRLGDLCLAIPTLQCLRSAYLDARFGIVLPRHLQPLARWACRPTQFFDYDDDETIAGQPWDLVIDLSTDYHLGPARLAARTRSPVRLGFDFKGRGRYFNIPMQLPDGEHMSRAYSRALTPLSISLERKPLPEFMPEEPVSEWRRHGVIVHPGAVHATQRWPADYFVELIRRILGSGETCLVLGAESERETVDNIVKRSGTGATAAIAKDVMQLAATIHSGDVMICNNSGPLHLAGLLGVPTISFMGPTVKSRWAPIGSHDVVLRRDNLACIGCNSGHCRIRTHACMKEITPDDAFAAYFRLRAMLLLESST